MLIQLINTGSVLKPEEYTRLWVTLGEPMQVSARYTLQVLEHSSGGRRALELQLSSNVLSHAWPLKAGGFADASKQANLLVMPRAAEIGEDGRTLRVFLEFVDSTPNRQLNLDEFI